MAVSGTLSPILGQIVQLLIQLVREILHLFSVKSQGKVKEFHKPLAVATM